MAPDGKHVPVLSCVEPPTSRSQISMRLDPDSIVFSLGASLELHRHRKPRSMLWRLPVSITCSAARGYSSGPTPARVAGPLRILFCGADHFSIASLRALTKAQREVPGLIHSIDVVHRPAKPTGRGLRTLTDGTRPHHPRMLSR